MTPTLAQALAILGDIDYHALAHDIALDLPGPRTANLEPARGGGNNSSPEPTKTETRAMQHQAVIEAAVVRIYTSALAIAAVQAARIPRHEPRRTTLQAETRGCTWHQQAGVEQHQPVWRNSDCGFLPQPVQLCHACFDYARAHGQRPTNEQIIRHNRTGKWTQRTTGKRSTVFSVDQVADHGLGKPA